MIQNNCNKTRKTITIIFLLTLSAMALAGCEKNTSLTSNTVKYNGTEYVFLEYPQNIFYYDYNGCDQDNFDEVDGIYPIDSSQWKIIWNGGDLYCDKNDSVAANNYYATDSNYDWYVLIDSEDMDESISYSIDVSDSDLHFLYDLEEIEKNVSAYFDEFESLGSIVKISKDGIVRGTLSIAKYKGSWYWKSEIIDESSSRDGTWPEYIQPLPESLNHQIIS